MFGRKKIKQQDIWEADVVDSGYYPDSGYGEPQRRGRPSRRPKRDEWDSAYDSYDDGRRTQRLFWAVVAVVAYAAFVLVGAFSTSYMTDPFGVKEAQVINVTLREDRDIYRVLLGHLLVQQQLLAKIAELDQQVMGTPPKDYFQMVTAYRDVLGEIDRYIVPGKAMVIPSRYASLKTATVASYNSIAIYLQKMSDALSNQDPTTLAEALSWRADAYRSYNQTLVNVAAFANMVKIDTADMQAKPLEPYAGVPDFGLAPSDGPATATDPNTK